MFHQLKKKYFGSVFKFLTGFFLILGLVFSLNSLVFANTACPNGTVFCGEEASTVLRTNVVNNLHGISQSESLIRVIMGWIQFFLPYAGVLAFGGIVYAGFLYLTGFAKEDNIDKAKNILMWSVIGLILIFISYPIVTTFIRPSSGSTSTTTVGGNTSVNPPAPTSTVSVPPPSN